MGRLTMQQPKVPMAQSPPVNKRPNILSDEGALRSISRTVLDLVIRFHELSNDSISQKNRISSSTVSRARNGRPVSVQYARRLTTRISELLQRAEGEQPQYKFDDLFEVVDDTVTSSEDDKDE